MTEEKIFLLQIKERIIFFHFFLSVFFSFFLLIGGRFGISLEPNLYIKEKEHLQNF